MVGTMMIMVARRASRIPAVRRLASMVRSDWRTPAPLVAAGVEIGTAGI